MAQKFTVPITVRQLSSAGSDAFTIYVDGDTFSRLQIQAGGRLVWGPGSGAADTNLYRDAVDVLKTDDTFKSAALFVGGIEISPSGAASGNALIYDGTKFVPGESGANVAISPTSPGSAEAGDLWFDSDTDVLHIYDGASWIEVSGSLELSGLDDVIISSPQDNQILRYSSASSSWYNDDESYFNINGGSATSVYEADDFVLNGGSAVM